MWVRATVHCGFVAAFAGALGVAVSWFGVDNVAFITPSGCGVGL